MRTLYLTLIGLTLVFACSMSFATLAVYDDTWWPGVVAGGILLFFLAVGGLVIPGPLRSLSGGQLRTARAAVIMFSSWWGLEFFIMALVTWALGRRGLAPDNGYLTLGLLIFLGLAGAGIQGVLAMTAWFVHVRNQAIVVPSRIEERLREARLGITHAVEPDAHGSHSAPMPGA
ncbi:MAG: hypothetical protein ACRDWE_01130 [Acidimicrobiales bacterium]